MRYVLPAFPFLFILISRVGKSFALGHRGFAVAVTAMCGWTVVSSLSVVPHSLSYYNELAGGPMGGHYHLGASNTDWGQDLLYLKKWFDQHPYARPLHLSYDQILINPELAGIDWIEIPVSSKSLSAADREPGDLGPQAGWYAVSVNKIHNREKDYDYFLEFKPAGYAGYSIYIYYTTVDEANRVRKKLGLPPLPESPGQSSTAPTGGR